MVRDSSQRAAKARESRVRRLARRHDLLLRKSRRRNPEALDYGSYWLVDLERNFLVAGGEWGWTLDDIEEFLTS